jgi:hypothetical protein
MMRRVSLQWCKVLRVAGVLVLVVAACGNGPKEDANSVSGGGDAGDTNAGSPVLRDYWEAKARALCYATMHCPVPNDDQLGARVQLETEERCEQYVLELLVRSADVRDIEALVQSNRVRFHPERVADCEPASECRFLPASAGECEGVFEGTLPTGAACRRDEECAGDSYCLAVTGPCDGRCTQKKPNGTACDEAQECQATDGIPSCDWQADPPVCRELFNSREAVEGEPCGLQTEDHIELCRGDFWCNATASSLGVCQRAISLGSACSDIDQPCEGLAFCGVGGVEDVCRVVTITHEVGGPCDGSHGINPTMCDPVSNLVCVDGQCEHTDGSEGSLCNSSDLGENQCQVGFYCNDETEPPTCAPLQAPGTECHSSWVCTETCDFENNVCTEQYCAAHGSP